MPNSQDNQDFCVFDDVEDDDAYYTSEGVASVADPEGHTESGSLSPVAAARERFLRSQQGTLLSEEESWCSRNVNMAGQDDAQGVQSPTLSQHHQRDAGEDRTELIPGQTTVIPRRLGSEGGNVGVTDQHHVVPSGLLTPEHVHDREPRSSPAAPQSAERLRAIATVVRNLQNFSGQAELAAMGAVVAENLEKLAADIGLPEPLGGGGHRSVSRDP